jgi:EAL domain-containing protein (putative c-di-GMP-specific phosphodiesterase class I)
MHMSVLAEGVENDTQLASLRDLGCHFAQGFLWSEGIGPDHATRWSGRADSSHADA